MRMKDDRFILNINGGVKVKYIGTGQFRLAYGKWEDAILYKENGVYKMMEASEFIRLAEPADPDKSTTLDRIGDIIGPGYVPGFEADKTQIPAYEVGCETISLKDENKDDGDPNRSK